MKEPDAEKGHLAMSFATYHGERSKGPFYREAGTRRAWLSSLVLTTSSLCLPASPVTSHPQNRHKNICISKLGGIKQDWGFHRNFDYFHFKKMF